MWCFFFRFMWYLYVLCVIFACHVWQFNISHILVWIWSASRILYIQYRGWGCARTSKTLREKILFSPGNTILRIIGNNNSQLVTQTFRWFLPICHGTPMSPLEKRGIDFLTPPWDLVQPAPLSQINDVHKTNRNGMLNSLHVELKYGKSERENACLI